MARTFIVFLIAVVVCSFPLSAQNKYIGVKMCSMCHKTEKQGKQFDIWQKAKHSQAYKTLTTAKADEFAKARGLTKPAAQSPECLECHTSEFAMDAKLVDKQFDFKDGVQCETCHAAGSKYKDLTIMKNKEKAVAAGMRDFKDQAAIEAYCKTCHNEKSPSYKEFKFEEMWGKIKHSVPKAG
jgi:cytochrome c peroxidase